MDDDISVSSKDQHDADNINNADWNSICTNTIMSEGFMRKYKRYILWDIAGITQDFDEAFMIEHIKYFTSSILIHQKLSDQVIIKYISHNDVWDFRPSTAYEERGIPSLPVADYRWKYIWQYQEVSEEFIIKYIKYADWSYIWQYQEVSNEFIDTYSEYIKWSLVFRHQKVSEAIIIKYIENADWSLISQYQILSSKFIDKYINLLDIDLICQYQILSEHTILDNITHFNRRLLFQYQPLSDTFLKRYKKYIRYEALAKNKKISDNSAQNYTNAA